MPKHVPVYMDKTTIKASGRSIFLFVFSFVLYCFACAWHCTFCGVNSTIMKYGHDYVISVPSFTLCHCAVKQYAVTWVVG